MNNSCIWKGKVQSVNRWHGAMCIKGSARIYETPAYKKFKTSLAATFKNLDKVSGYVDLQVTVVLSSRADTGNIDKPIGDALELAGVLENDKFIRNIAYYRHYHPNSGSKNKFEDVLMVELTKVPADELEIMEHQQKYDDFNVRKI